MARKQKDVDRKMKSDSFQEMHSDESDGELDELSRLTMAAVKNCDVADAGIHRQNDLIKHTDDYAPWINEVKNQLAGGDNDKNHVDEKQVDHTKETKRSLCAKFLMFDKCAQQFRRVTACCQRDDNTPPPTTFCSKLKYALLCPPSGLLPRGIFYIFLLLLVWSVLWSVLGKLAEPGGHIFALFILWITAVLLGRFAEFFRLPALLGMLVMGFMLKNVPHINIAEDLNPRWSSSIRSIALVVILIRAGLGLDPGALRRLSCVCVRLAFLPCLLESLTIAFVSHFLLDFPWSWGIMMGFVLAAVSPAVVVPSLLSLQERYYGVEKGIPTLIIASASIDDVLAIGGFGVTLGITFSTGNLLTAILQGPLEVVIGLVYGVIIGFMLWYIPEPNTYDVNYGRTAVIFLSGIFAVFGSRILAVAGSGPLACLVLSFIAAFRWRSEVNNRLEAVSSHFALFWQVFQPFLFALIGAEVSVEALQLDTVGLGLGTLFCGLIVRLVISFFSVLGVGFNIGERLFIALAWLPKATVQAAIGSIALDYARAKDSSDEVINYGIQIVTIAVLAIMVTAPLGAAAIALTGPKLLSCDVPKQHTVNSIQTTEL